MKNQLNSLKTDTVAFCPDSVTSACFSVTYAKGRMCSYKQTSVDEPCSITYPTGVVSTHIDHPPPYLPLIPLNWYFINRDYCI